MGFDHGVPTCVLQSGGAMQLLCYMRIVQYLPSYYEALDYSTLQVLSHGPPYS